MRIVAQVRETLGEEYKDFLGSLAEYDKPDFKVKNKEQAAIETKAEYNQIIAATHKDQVRRGLMKVYKTLGYRGFMQEIEVIRNLKFNQANLVGEVAEVVLDIVLHKYKQIHQLQTWAIFSSFIVKINEYTTEIDFIIATPYHISAIEVKCYGGDKRITDPCIVNRKGKSKTDIYEQNRKHILALIKVYQSYIKNPVGAFKSVFFSFSRGSFEDVRSEACKRLMPAYNLEDIVQYLDILRLTKQPIRWEYVPLIKRMVKDYKGAPSIEQHIQNIERIKKSKN